MAEVSPPLFMDVSSVYSGDELGLPLRDLVTEGTVTATSLAVSQRAAGANLSVDIAPGACYVLGDTNVDRQPCYRCINDAVVNKGISPDPSNPRKVLVVAQVVDEGFAGSGRLWRLDAIHGTPAGSPVEPALPASALPLALIDVTAADASIVNAQITDRRVRASIPGQLGGAWTSYTPTWTGTGTNPAIGNGTITGAYQKIAKTVIGQARIEMGSTTMFGSAGWVIGLPLAARTDALPNPLSFLVWLKDASAGEFKAFTRANSASDVIPFSGGDATVATLVSGTVPFPWTTGDALIMLFMFEAA